MAKREQGKNDTLNKFFTYIKITVALSGLAYAYLYLIGYFYLFSYFKEWGLSPIEIGFSIIDYATVAMYPIFYLIIFFLINVSIGFFISYKLPFIEKKNKNVRFLIFRSLLVLLFVPFTLLMYLMSGYSEAFLAPEWYVVSSLFLAFGYYWGVSIGTYVRFRNNLTKKLLYIPSLIFLVILPLFSLWVGGNFGKSRSAYTYIFFNPPSGPIKVVIETITPIHELEIFEEEKNKYRGLMLLVYKNDIYYFAPDWSELKKRGNESMDQGKDEIYFIFGEISVELKKFRDNEIDIKLKTIREDLDIFIKDKKKSEKVQRLEKIDAELDAIEKMIKKDINMLSTIKERHDELITKLSQLLKLYHSLTNMTYSVFSIGKEQIKYIIHL